LQSGNKYVVRQFDSIIKGESHCLVPLEASLSVVVFRAEKSGAHHLSAETEPVASEIIIKR
jgi:hypothetical protein